MRPQINEYWACVSALFTQKRRVYSRAFSALAVPHFVPLVLGIAVPQVNRDKKQHMTMRYGNDVCMYINTLGSVLVTCL
jgi:hypothetical protein